MEEDAYIDALMEIMNALKKVPDDSIDRATTLTVAMLLNISQEKGV